MQPKRDLAIILRSVPFQERHRVVTALTEHHGQISALARNSIQSRRFGGTLDLFAASEWHFVDRSQNSSADLCQLKEAHIRRAYDGFRKDFERLSMASVFNELMLKLAPQHEPCPELFRLHSNALAALEEAPSDINLTLLNGYLAKLLHWHGHQPKLDACLGCALPIDETEPNQTLRCAVSDAGWFCASCRPEQTLMRITREAIVDFQISIMVPIRQVPVAAQASKQAHRELFKFLEALLIYHLPGFDRQPLKSLRFINLN